MKLDAFTRVKKAIDDMVAELAKQQEDEVKHKDFCTDEFNTNQLQTEKTERKKQDLIATIEDLQMCCPASRDAAPFEPVSYTCSNGGRSRPRDTAPSWTRELATCCELSVRR